MFRRYRWLTILVPALAVGAIELLSDSLLDVAFPVPLDTVLIVAVVLVLSGVFSLVAYRRTDALTARLEAQNRTLEARNATARALHRVSVAITALADLDPILAAVVDSARDLLHADVAVLLLAASDGRLVPRAQSGPAEAILSAEATEGPGSADDEPRDDALRFLDPAHAVARLAAPLQRAGGTVGLLVVGSRSPRAFDVDEVEALASLANQAAIAIENARLQERLRELAVLEERERIAREMHDGLAQVLGYVNTKSQAVDQYLATGRIAEARAQLAELSGAARSVYVDVREAILGLRSPIVPGAGLVAAVEEYTRRFAEASKLAVAVTATGEARAARLAPDAEAQVFRIVQEALTNVRKHAEAHRARLDVDVVRDALVVRVTDDGRGFPPDEPAPPGKPAADWPRYGLQAMRERAASIGATVAWSSPAQAGATVTLEVPLESPAGPTPSPAGPTPSPAGPAPSPALPPTGATAGAESG